MAKKKAASRKAPKAKAAKAAKKAPAKAAKKAPAKAAPAKAARVKAPPLGTAGPMAKTKIPKGTKRAPVIGAKKFGPARPTAKQYSAMIAASKPKAAKAMPKVGSAASPERSGSDSF